jgi:predicted nucleic acid-binding protein
MPEIVFDCCVVSNFALAGSLGLIEALYGDKAYVTGFVAAEVMRGIQAGHSRLEAVTKALQDGWLKETGLETGEEKRLFESLSRSVGLGKASSIAVAKGCGSVFACDDRAARSEAAALKVRLTGTLGILAKAARTGACDLKAADGCLARMIEAGFFSPVNSIQGIISKRKARR